MAHWSVYKYEANRLKQGESMEKKKYQISDDSLDDVSGGRMLDLGSWTFDIVCPFCGKDDQLQQGMQMYSSQTGLSIVYCLRCKKPFGFNEKGETFRVQED